jgi:hypothetical protein
MKPYVSWTRLSATLAAIILASQTLHAQMPGANATAGLSGSLIKLFGNNNAFIAKAEVQVLDPSQKEIMSMPMDFALLDTKIRVEMDLTQMRNRDMPAGMAAQLKQMGMAQVISIIRPDKKLAYAIYPDQKSLMSLPLPKESAEPDDTKGKLEMTPIGNETIDGHACVKNKVKLADGQGKTVEATTWNAKDLKDFPIQIETKEDANSSFMRFKQVQFTKPDASQFEPPTGFAVYTSQQELMQGMMKKMMEAGPKK